MSTQIQKINYIPTLVLRYWFLIWGTLSKPNHARPHPPDTNELVYCFHSFLSTCKKFTSCINSFLRYWSFRNPAIWLMEIIVGHNSRIKILSDMKFAMGSHKLQGFSFQTIFRKIIVCIRESTSLKNTTTVKNEFTSKIGWEEVTRLPCQEVPRTNVWLVWVFR